MFISNALVFNEFYNSYNPFSMNPEAHHILISRIHARTHTTMHEIVSELSYQKYQNITHLAIIAGM